ncbi:MAG: hypothetical protein K9W43_03970 [Candidatus Thorarchaeota archaeon]|nr:hypothetical protein [Candidatus Thorarchaeota archaeon]
MSRSARQIPKAIAEFGERQFKETGPQAVEVLRVKASTIRKHFRRLAGIAYLVAVISRDRVRVYFFDMAANMLLGENLDHSVYTKIRKASRLITKYEKPHEPTPEELRMEATEEIRSLLAKSIKRVARSVARPEPPFPELYVTREKTSVGQNFGVAFEKDGTVVLEESVVRSQWIDGIALRLAFLLYLDSERRDSEVASCVANGVALSLLRDEPADRWLAAWLKKSNGGDMTRYVNHLIRHVPTYSGQGFQWLLSLLEQATPPLEWDQFRNALHVIHNGLVVPLGTGEYHVIKGFCDSLSTPRRLGSKRHVLTSIHLAPRAIGDPLPLGRSISLTHNPVDDPSVIWAGVKYVSSSEVQQLTVGEVDGPSLRAIEYGLNLEDIFPKTGGILSHGKDLINMALRMMGVDVSVTNTFSRRLEFHKAVLPTDQKAVLERLCQGGLKILSDSLVGSLQRITSLLTSGHLVLLPNFNHMGIDHDFLVSGNPSAVKTIVSQSTVEYTLFLTDETSYGVVSAPSTWRSLFLNSCHTAGLRVHPILETQSTRGVLRDETVFPSDSDHLLWT